ncbi:hypothetical protein SAY87_030362 [Trapa incisa]|uniref:Uncharacterized protein n=1 Tax=Trapa incisa TaxID=236973 RepID=A0AAN7KNC8_9MYRT|nr:hypothetical protein SAY87_030362 [Trapa incisa]
MDRRLDFNQPFLSVRRFAPSEPPTEPVIKPGVKPDPFPPKVPPRLPSYRSELKSGPLRKPGTVPFTWEQSPGRPKSEGPRQDWSHLQQPPEAPKLHPSRTPDWPLEAPAVTSDGILKPDLKQGEPIRVGEDSSKEIQSPENALEEDDDDAYYDAPDKLGRSESFFYNCSNSGLSGLDGPDIGQIGGTFARGQLVQDFMMDRFLPAAKAMASEMPPHSHAPKKQRSPPPAATGDPPRFRLKKAANGNNGHHPLLRYNSSFLSRYMMQAEYVDEDNEPEEGSSLKLCGLLPRFMMKSSVCTEDHEQDSVNRNVDNPDRKRESPKRNRSNRPILQEGRQQNVCTSFRDLLAIEGHEWRSSSGSGGPVVERTLYVDSVRTTEKLLSSLTGSISGPPSYRGIDFDANTGIIHGMAKGADFSVESLPRDIKEISIVDGSGEPVKDVRISSTSGDGRSIGAKLSSSSSDSGLRSINLEIPVEEKDISSRWPTDGKINKEEDEPPMRHSNHQNDHPPLPPTAGSAFHIPPLRPKTPAESWLIRTLPSISTRKSLTRFSPSSHEVEKFQMAPRSPAVDRRCETIVRMPRPSTEMLTTIPES